LAEHWAAALRLCDEKSTHLQRIQGMEGMDRSEITKSGETNFHGEERKRVEAANALEMCGPKPLRMLARRQRAPDTKHRLLQV